MDIDSNTSLSNESAQSPSLALLVRLQELRKWQEKQREALMQTHSDSSIDVSVDSSNYLSPGNWNTESFKNTPESQVSRSSLSSFPYSWDKVQKGVQTTLSHKVTSCKVEDDLQSIEAIVPSPCNNSPGSSASSKNTPDSQLFGSSKDNLSPQQENTSKGEQQFSKQKAFKANDDYDLGHVDNDDNSTSHISTQQMEEMHITKNKVYFQTHSSQHCETNFTDERPFINKAPLVKPVVITQPQEEQAIRNVGKSFNDLQEISLDENSPENSKDHIKPKKQYLSKKSGLSFEGQNDNKIRMVNPPTSTLYLDAERRSEPKQIKPKQKFLKKGEGTARFRMAPLRLKNKLAIQGHKKELSKNVVPHNHERVPENNENIPITMKGSQQRSIPDRKLLQTYPNRISNRPIQTLKLEEIPTHRGVFETPRKEQQYTLMYRNETTDSKGNSLNSENASGPSVLKQLEEDKQRRKEQEELSAFEKLEELAADSSFSSNSSTIVHLLQKGQRSASSTPLRSPPPFSPLETPIAKFEKPSQGSNSVSRNLLQRLVQIPEEAFQNKEKGDQVGYQQSGLQNQTQQSDQYQLNQSPHHQPQQPLNVSEVLKQLRSIVRLEKTEDVELSQKDLQAFVESFSYRVASPQELVTQFPHGSNQPISTSTPAHPPGISPASGPRVHFRSEGVEVLEYEPSDTEHEDTLTDATSIAEDDTDLITTSDLEALALFNMQKCSAEKAGLCKEAICIEEQSTDDESTSTLTGDRCPSTPQNQVQPLMLQFSPPPQRPQHSASNYIWSIFGKNRDAGKGFQRKNHPSQDMKSKELHQQTQRSVQEFGNTEVSEQVQVLQIEKAQSLHKNEERCIDEEIESHKALLLAKMYELEKETKCFKKETLKLKKLQDTFQNEKKKIAEEKQTAVESLEREKINFQKYIDKERNSLWKEKQELKRTAPSLTMVQDKSLEIVYLKEQMEDLREEMKRKESLNQFALKKLNDKIKTLEQENRQLKEKNASLQIVEKENLYLRHKLDRTKLSKKAALRDTQNNQSRGHKVKTKVVTIDTINKSLSKRLTDAPVKLITSHKESAISTQEQQSLTSHRESPLSTQEQKTEEQCLHKTADEPLLAEENGSTKSKYLTQMSTIQSPDMPVVDKTKHLSSSMGINSEDKIPEYTEHHQSDGSIEVIYANGNKKIVNPDGSIIVSYYNGDRKEIHSNKTVYVYGTDQTSHITFNDGKEILDFPNGQREIRFPDGSSEIIFGDNSRKITSSDGTEICTMKDGTVVRTNPDGTKVFEFTTGQREIHTSREKRREYPDGTVKILHSDGRTETLYKTGRVRIKDHEGNIISDLHQGVQ